MASMLSPCSPRSVWTVVAAPTLPPVTGSAEMGAVLDGISVVDLSHGIAGAMATMLLADNGADVIAVEPAGGRSFAPYGGRPVWGRGKRSAVLDRNSPDDRRTLRGLVARADVVVDTPRADADDDDLWADAPPTVDPGRPHRLWAR